LGVSAAVRADVELRLKPRESRILPVPALVADVGPKATKRFLRIFHSTDLRQEYPDRGLIKRSTNFWPWYDEAGSQRLEDTEPITVGARFSPAARNVLIFRDTLNHASDRYGEGING
jgi:hypothetical protein